MPDAHTLIVYDHERRIVFKMQYLNSQAIRIWGDFYLRNGRRVIIDDETDTMYGGWGAGNVVHVGDPGTAKGDYVLFNDFTVESANAYFGELPTITRLPRLDSEALVPQLKSLSFPELTVQVATANTSRPLAIELIRIMRDAGWTVLEEPYLNPCIGVRIETHGSPDWDDQRANKATYALTDILNSSGIPTERKGRLDDPTLRITNFRVVVGPIPPTRSSSSAANPEH
jgi:hypothetical protein